MTLVLTLTFEPPDQHGVQRVIWALDDHPPVVVSLQPPFAPESWELIVRALNARQYPDYDQYPTRLRATSADYATLQHYDLCDPQTQRLFPNLHERVGRQLGAALLADRQVQEMLQMLRAADGTIALVFVPDEHNTQHSGALPWELAFDGPQPWLLRAGRVLPCVRLFAADPPNVTPSTPPQLLLLVPQAGMHDAARRYEREARRALRDALGEHVRIEWLGPPLTMDALDERLRLGPPLLLIDYYGHGLLKDGQGHLLFDDGAGGSDPVSAARLQTLPNIPPFWIISACQSAQQSPSEELIANLAPALVATPRVAAVLAMQLTTRMAAATDQIVPAIYETLAQGQSLQAAAAEARRRLYAAEKDSASFYLPTLYSRQRRPEPLFLLPHAHALPPPPPSPSAPPRGNPFTPGNVVPPERFVGRRRERAEILASLENQLSVSLVGAARIGKSSLLRYLEASLPTQLGAHGRYLPIRLSMDAQPDQASFCRAVLEQVLPHVPPGTGQEPALRALEQRIVSGAPITLEQLTRVLEWAAHADLRVVLLLDEFKTLLERATEFDAVFRGALRSLYTNGTVALVLATRQPLREIAELNAYFVNGVSRIDLHVLPDAEAEQLIRQSSDRPFTEEEVRLALDVGRRHPLRLQWAGFFLYHAKGAGADPLYDPAGGLSDRAAAILSREVQQKVDEAMAASTDHRRGGVGWWLEAVGGLGSSVGEAADAAKQRLLGAFIVIAVFVLVGLLVAWAAGAISLDDVGRLLRLLSGGS